MKTIKKQTMLKFKKKRKEGNNGQALFAVTICLFVHSPSLCDVDLLSGVHITH